MHQHPSTVPALRTPIVDRTPITWVGLSLLLAASGAMAQPQGPLSEADIAARARRASPLASIADATDDLAAARARTAGLRDNPSLAWDREAVPARAGGSQDIFRATVPIDLMGPGAALDLQAARSAELRVDAQLLRDDAALRAVQLYHSLLFARAQADVLAAAVADLDEATRVLQRREAAGSSSGYESTRLHLAGELGRSRHAEAVGEVNALHSALAELLGMPEGGLAVAEAAPPIPVAMAESLAESLAESPAESPAGGGAAQRTSLRLAQRAQALGAEAEAGARHTWVPTLQATGGLKHADAGGPNGTAFGYAVGLELDVPLFDHGQAARSEAHAQRALSAARHHGLRRQAAAQAREALQRYRAAHAELARFEAQTSTHVDVLLTAARAGYAEGERNILELLDAQRAQTEVRVRRLTLIRDAKQAEARLRAAVGDL